MNFTHIAIITLYREMLHSQVKREKKKEKGREKEDL